MDVAHEHKDGANPSISFCIGHTPRASGLHQHGTPHMCPPVQSPPLSGCVVTTIKGSQHIAAHCSHSNASGTAPAEISSPQSQQPSATVYCLVLLRNHLVGCQADPLRLICSFPDQDKGVRAKRFGNLMWQCRIIGY